MNMAPDVRKPGTGINIFIDDDPPITGARIKVIGIGGGGGWYGGGGTLGGGGASGGWD